MHTSVEGIIEKNNDSLQRLFVSRKRIPPCCGRGRVVGMQMKQSGSRALAVHGTTGRLYGTKDRAREHTQG